MTHRRSAGIWIRGRFVPYPLQYKLRYLDPADRRDALDGLRDAAHGAALDAAGSATTFDTWTTCSFGAGLARLYFEPCNRKVWPCRLCRDLPSAAAAIASHFIYASTCVVAVGVEGILPPHRATKSWIYFPEGQSPSCRVTVLSNYPPHNVPAAGYGSRLAEVSASAHRPVPRGDVSRRVVEALRADGLLPADTRIVRVWLPTAEHGYPTPFVGRWQALRYLREVFEAAGVYPRGRFGSWIHEISNPDHCFMRGVEATRRLRGPGSETTPERPGEANEGRHLQSAVARTPAFRVSS